MAEPQSAAYAFQSIDRIIAVINSGDDCAAATREYNTLVASLREAVHQHGGAHKGSITLKLDFVANDRGVDVSLTTSVKAPARPKTLDRYFIDEQSNVLTAMDPARETLFAGENLGRKTGLSAVSG